jgi:hypothetical protein
MLRHCWRSFSFLRRMRAKAAAPTAMISPTLCRMPSRAFSLLHSPFVFAAALQVM